MSKTSRFSSISWAKLAASNRVCIVGLGGIGSWLSLFLSRIGYQTILIDFDTIEEHNLGGQLYADSYVGGKKIDAINAMLTDFAGYSNRQFYGDVFESFMAEYCTILVSAVDKMSVRRQLFEHFKANLATIKLFVDGRMNAEQYTIYFVTADCLEEYEKTLFEDDEIEDTLCTNKATSHFGASIASDITKGINNYVSIYQANEPRRLPFSITDEGYLFIRQIKDPDGNSKTESI
jgi:hypothetical protein